MLSDSLNVGIITSDFFSKKFSTIIEDFPKAAKDSDVTVTNPT